MSAEALNQAFELKNTGCSNSAHAATMPGHRWYLVKEAFSPRLVERAMDEMNTPSNDVILDPFCGSGTVPLVASVRETSSLGLEVNPFLAFVSRVKLLRVRSATLGRHADTVMAAAKSGVSSPLERFSTFCETDGASKWLFNRAVLRSFEGAWQATSAIACPSRDLVRLALLGAAMDNCNAVRDGKCLRYRTERQRSNFGQGDLIGAFERRISQMKDDLEGLPPGGTSGVIELGDCRRTLKKASKFRLCVTSPPYLNSFDYSDIYRPELFLGRFVRNNEELMTLRLKTLRSHVQAKWESPTKNSFGLIYDEMVQKILGRRHLLWSSRLPLMIQAYFEDLQDVLAGLLRIATDDASVWIVVSTSAYAGVEIPVDLILADIGSKLGWRLREIGVLRYLRTAGQHWAMLEESQERKPELRESVVIFDRGRRARTSS